MSKYMRGFTGLVAAFVLASSNVGATPILVDPTMSGSSVDADIVWDNCIGCFINATLSGGLEGEATFLDIGDAYTFDFFDVTVGGFFGAALVNVDAALAFSSPGTTALGDGFGGFASLFFVLNSGFLTWNQPDPISLSDGSWLGVVFEDLFDFGFGNHATVAATVYRYGEVAAAVPEPGSLALLCLGLCALWAVQRRRHASPSPAIVRA